MIYENKLKQLSGYSLMTPLCISVNDKWKWFYNTPTLTSTTWLPGETNGKCNSHPQKCSVLEITRNKTTEIHQYQLHGPIVETEKNRIYLGVKINNNLSWNNHTDNITKKANNSIAFLWKNLQISEQNIKTKAYTTHVRSQVECTAAVYDPWGNTKYTSWKSHMHVLLFSFFFYAIFVLIPFASLNQQRTHTLPANKPCRGGWLKSR